MTATMERTASRSLISPDLFDKLVGRIVTDGDVSAELAERIMDQALAFLGTCALDHAEPLVPSDIVDIGWHAFILYTKEYATFCADVAGRFLHHTPTDKEDPTATGVAASTALVRTVAAMEVAGFAVDTDLWPRGAAVDYTGCHNGCHDDPPPVRPSFNQAKMCR